MSKIATGKVFGIGLPKTGTVSLTHALKILGYSAIHQPLPGQIPGLEKTVALYDASCGTQLAWNDNYKQLDKFFPNSRFILTTRSLSSWLRSYETWSLGYPFTYYNIFGGPTYTEDFNREKLTKDFVEYHNSVEEYFKDRPNDLLIMDFSRGDAWKKLCKFLSKPIPKILFPHENKNKSGWKKLYNQLDREDNW